MAISARCLVKSAANYLAVPDAAEAEYRAVISRAYYGAFHSANFFARDTLRIDLDNVVGGKHIVLSSALNKYECPCEETQEEIRRAGARLRIFHTLRIRADYLVSDTIMKSEAEAQIRNSGLIIEKFESLTQKLAA